MSNFEKISNQWSIEQSRELYHVPAWSDDYVDIDDQGQVIVKPTRTETHNGVNLIKLTQQLQQKGLALPVLVRFSDILKDRVNV